MCTRKGLLFPARSYCDHSTRCTYHCLQEQYESEDSPRGPSSPTSPRRHVRAAAASPRSPVSPYDRPASAALSLRSFGRPASSRLFSAKVRPLTTEAKSPSKIKAGSGRSTSPVKATATTEPSQARKASAVITKPWIAASPPTSQQQENKAAIGSSKAGAAPAHLSVSPDPRHALQESPST